MRFTHVADVTIVYSRCHAICHCINISQFVHSNVEGQWGCFQFGLLKIMQLWTSCIVKMEYALKILSHLKLKMQKAIPEDTKKYTKADGMGVESNLEKRSIQACFHPLPPPPSLLAPSQERASSRAIVVVRPSDRLNQRKF